MNGPDDSRGSAWPGDLPGVLADRLQQPLPGRAAHRPFVASLCYGRHQGPVLPTTQAAAVLVVLVKTASGWKVPMTRRPAEMVQHAGQICFPGGAIEAGEDVEEAALREFEEELGVSLSRQQVIGRLTPLWVFASDFWVTPVLACYQGPLQYCANPGEVEDVIEVDAAALRNPAVYQQRLIRVHPFEMMAPVICLEDQVIWGASCMILGELMALMDEIAGLVN